MKSDRLIPGLVDQPEPAAADVEVCHDAPAAWWRRFLEKPQELWHSGSPEKPSGEPAYKAWQIDGGRYFRLRYIDGCQFVMNRAGTRLWASGPEAATPEYLATYLLGPVLGRLLRLRGTPCLHGSAVAAGGYALAVLGFPGAGKSTTAAAFARLGFPVLSDDITVLREEGDAFWVLPGDPNLCLWPQSVSYLYGSPTALPLIISQNVLMPEWDKRGLDLTGPGYRFQSRPLPLGGIYILGERQEEAGPRVEEVPGKERLLLLLANTYGSSFLDKNLRAREFEVLGRLLERAPVRRLIPRGGSAYLPRLCEAILRDFSNLRSRGEYPGKNLR
ncbi:MAG: hypothetical protein FJ135_17335 [Deltaproteobacteria bacterium]|nr:hypothetical protein [Deltaproteobacteria bacterium]